MVNHMKQTLSNIRARKLIWALALAVPLGACNALFGEEVARLPVNVVSTDGNQVVKEASLQLQKAEEVAMWSDMDLAYEGQQPLRFQVVVTKDGAPFKQLEINPTVKNLTVGEVRTKMNGKITWRFTGKNAELKVPANGTYLFKARLVAATSNPTLKITKAELVLKK